MGEEAALGAEEKSWMGKWGGYGHTLLYICMEDIFYNKEKGSISKNMTVMCHQEEEQNQVLFKKQFLLIWGPGTVKLYFKHK